MVLRTNGGRLGNMHKSGPSGGITRKPFFDQKLSKTAERLGKSIGTSVFRYFRLVGSFLSLFRIVRALIELLGPE